MTSLPLCRISVFEYFAYFLAVLGYEIIFSGRHSSKLWSVFFGERNLDNSFCITSAWSSDSFLPVNWTAKPQPPFPSATSVGPCFANYTLLFYQSDIYVDRETTTNIFQIRSTLAGCEELAGGFKPDRNWEIFWIINHWIYPTSVRKKIVILLLL